MSAAVWRIVVVLAWVAALIAFAAAVLRAHEGEAAHSGPSGPSLAMTKSVVTPTCLASVERIDWG